MTYTEAKALVLDMMRYAPPTYDLAERILRDAGKNRLADLAAERAKLERQRAWEHV